MQHTDTLYTCDTCGMGMHGYFPVSLHNINIKVCNTCHTKLIAMRDSLPTTKYVFTVAIHIEATNPDAALTYMVRKLDRSGLVYEHTGTFAESLDASTGSRDTEPSPGSQEADSSMDSGQPRTGAGVEDSSTIYGYPKR